MELYISMHLSTSISFLSDDTFSPASLCYSVAPTHLRCVPVSVCVCFVCACLNETCMPAILLCLVRKTPSEYVCTQLNTCKQCFFYLLKQIVAFS